MPDIMPVSMQDQLYSGKSEMRKEIRFDQSQAARGCALLAVIMSKKDYVCMPGRQS